jgi:hypothetical protein
VVLRLLVVALGALVLAGGASASRAPTPKERAAIEFAVRFAPMMGRGNKLTFERIRVSTVNARYALVVVRVRSADGSPVGKPTVLLHRDAQAWRVIFLGTARPPCDVAPAKVRADLLGTRACVA